MTTGGSDMKPAGPRHAPRTSPSMEQYIEKIADLLTQHKVCSVSDIAQEANVSRAAASRAVRDLAGKKLVSHESYGYVDLTPAGHALAERLNARHQALFEFLSQVLRYDKGLADQEACRLEHQIDDDTVSRLARLTAFFETRQDASAQWRRELSQFLRAPAPID